MLTQIEFGQICDVVYYECGINLNGDKKQLLESRLAKRLRATGINLVSDYLRLIKEDEGEKLRFLDAVSTNHTYFFRESRHFQCLQPHHQTIWCAACSSGEEPYSVAIGCLEKGFKPTIRATDISTRVLQIGKKAIYPVEKAKSIPSHLLKKYFDRGIGKWEGYIRVKKDLRDMVTFKRFNLLNDPPPQERFNVIFCRNVLMYFDNEVKERVVNRLYKALKWNGYFIIGGAESLAGITHLYRYIEPSIYQKVSS